MSESRTWPRNLGDRCREPLVNRDLFGPFRRLNASRVFFFVYLCALFGHQLGTGFDAVFVRGSFIAYVFVSLITVVARTIKGGESGRLLSPFLVWLLVFWSWAYVSVFWAANTSYAFYPAYINNVAQILVVSVLVVADVRSRDDVILYLKMLLFANLYSEALLFANTPAGAWGTERVGEAIGVQFNSLGMRTAIAAFVSLLLFWETKNVFYLALIVPSAFISFFSGSRKAFLILVASITLFMVFVNRGFRAVRNVLIVCAVLFVVYLLVMTNEDLYHILGRRLENLFSYFLGEGTTEMSSLEREFYRVYARQMWEQSPVVGWGFNQFAAQMLAINYSHVAYSHCNYWELLSCLGIVGFLLYYGFYLYLIKRLWKKAPRKDPLVLFALVLLVVLVVMEYGFVAFVGIDEYVYLLIIFLVGRLGEVVSSFEKQGARQGLYVVSQRKW